MPISTETNDSVPMLVQLLLDKGCCVPSSRMTTR